MMPSLSPAFGRRLFRLLLVVALTWAQPTLAAVTYFTDNQAGNDAPNEYLIFGPGQIVGAHGSKQPSKMTGQGRRFKVKSLGSVGQVLAEACLQPVTMARELP